MYVLPLVWKIVCKAAALMVPPVYIPDMIPPISVPSLRPLPKRTYPAPTAIATDRNPLTTTLSCKLHSLREKLHPKSIIGMASGTIILGSSSWSVSTAFGSIGMLPMIMPTAYSTMIGPIFFRMALRLHM